MYELTVSEAATVLSILSKSKENEGIDPGLPGIPTSTFYAIRRKLYEAGWLSDRYVPMPWSTGIASVECRLSSPGPGDRGRIERDWAACPENVVVWSGTNVIFGVFFLRKSGPALGNEGTTISVTRDSGSLPVYFDYARSWSRFIGVGHGTGYPHSLGDALRSTARPIGPALGGILGRDGPDDHGSTRSRRWHSNSGLSRGEQRLLEGGLVQDRTFLNTDLLPPFEGRALGEIVFLTGSLREGITSADLLDSLNNECQVSPLLLIEANSKVLMIALGQIDPAIPQRTRISRSRQSVVGTIDRALTNTKMMVEPNKSVKRIVDHRYGYLFAQS